MQFKKLFAVGLLVEDLQRSVEFYQKLGVNVREKDKGFAHVNLDGVDFALLQKEEARELFSPENIRKGGSVIISFEVKNVKEFCRKIQKKGITPFSGPLTTSWGQTVAYFKDPDENIIEITEPFEG